MSGYPIDLRLKHPTLNTFMADKIPVDTTYFDNTGSLVTPKDVITQQGNTFNGASQLVKLDANSKLPAVDGSNLTNVTAQNMSPYTPYSVTSAKTSSGYASYVTKASNTQIDFDTNSGSTPIKICYPDGTVESNTTLSSITGISTDGTYYIVKEKGGNPYITTLQPVESIVAPSSPSNNQLWLDLSVIPYIPRKWNGTAWDITQFVKLGEFIRTSGVIGTPISYALNGRTTRIITYTGGFQSVLHNMGYIPQLLTAEVRLMCLVAQAGFFVGEIAQFGADLGTGYSAATHNASIMNNGTVGFGQLSNLEVITKTNTTAIPASNNWAYVFEIKRTF